MTDDPTTFFWETADLFLREEGISQGTMMGFPCLRSNGAFFASADPKTGHLIAKLPATRVTELIEAGDGQTFAPAGRRFREWVQVSERSEVRWEQLMREALHFVTD